MKGFTQDHVTSKGKEKVIDVILNEVPSLTQLKRQIHLLNESYTQLRKFEKRGCYFCMEERILKSYILC